MEQLREWKERWNNSDVKFVPELFEMVENLQKELENKKHELKQENTWKGRLR